MKYLLVAIVFIGCKEKHCYGSINENSITSINQDTVFLARPLDSIYIIKNHGEQP